METSFMKEEIISKMDFKTQTEFQRRKIRDEAIWGGPETGGEMPDIYGASGGSGLIGGQARVHGGVTCAVP